MFYLYSYTLHVTTLHITVILILIFLKIEFFFREINKYILCDKNIENASRSSLVDIALVKRPRGSVYYFNYSKY